MNEKKERPGADIVDRLTEAITNLDEILRETEGVQELQGESQMYAGRGQVISFYIEGAYFHMERHPGTIRAQEMSFGDQT